jgi:hypothetical protein
MPPTPGGEWAVAHFNIDAMHSNDTHRRVLDPKQQYERFYFTLNGAAKESWLELAWVIIWRGEDKEAPAPPGEPKASAADGKCRISWGLSQDNLMVRCYHLLRKDGEDWKRVTVATGLFVELPEKELPPGEYVIKAEDVAGNLSAPSTPFSLPSAQK